MRRLIPFLVFKYAGYLPTWVYGRKALLDMSLMYMVVNAMAKAGRFEA